MLPRSEVPPALVFHLVPQHSDDDSRRNLDIAEGPVTPCDEMLQSIVQQLRASWRSPERQ
ncbi:hypothetical protein OSC27_05585 [Microbacterium sp. STN6]|uniref:hypothetical protein n=1 Tax=Microbacterium sp. STN6 TaxID=2995588 RepID=UPI002260925D|nr:hypothetical protein [Microbacterium sp. STN6]MCX7521749.1 hypothetical protein [Microbacterium sp. STN6]